MKDASDESGPIGPIAEGGSSHIPIRASHDGRYRERCLFPVRAPPSPKLLVFAPDQIGPSPKVLSPPERGTRF